MNKENICECCGHKKASESFSATTLLLDYNGTTISPKTKWHNRQLVVLCYKCSNELFELIDEKVNIKKQKVLL